MKTVDGEDHEQITGADDFGVSAVRNKSCDELSPRQHVSIGHVP